MIRRQALADNATKLTFAVADSGVPVALVSDLTAWDPSVHPMVKRSNGTRSVAVVVPTGTAVRFRYAYANGRYDNDAEADRFEPSGYGPDNCVVVA